MDIYMHPMIYVDVIIHCWWIYTCIVWFMWMWLFIADGYKHASHDLCGCNYSLLMDIYMHPMIYVDVIIHCWWIYIYMHPMIYMDVIIHCWWIYTCIPWFMWMQLFIADGYIHASHDLCGCNYSLLMDIYMHPMIYVNVIIHCWWIYTCIPWFMWM